MVYLESARTRGKSLAPEKVAPNSGRGNTHEVQDRFSLGPPQLIRGGGTA